MLSMLCFALSRHAPGDTVRQRMSVDGTLGGPVEYADDLANYRRTARKLGYDRPAFYFGLSNQALPDTLYRILVPAHRRTARQLATRFGDWERVQAYLRALMAVAVQEDRGAAAIARDLLQTSDPDRIAERIGQMQNKEAASELSRAFTEMLERQDRTAVFVPRITLYGLDNQYHRYLGSLLNGRLGVSSVDGRPVSSKLRNAMVPTLWLNGISLLMIYLLGVPLGLAMAYFRGSTFDRWATLITFVGFGIPVFWAATLLANLFTTPAFGMNWFPTMGFGSVPDAAGWFTRLRIHFAHLFLPVCCLIYPSLAYVSRHLRSAATAELGRPYVGTAYMKGLSGFQVIFKHVFRNAAYPLVTLVGGILPALLAGSVLVEQIFNIPGMGKLLYLSARAQDWPVILALVLLNGLLTVIGLTVADIGYALLDPRVRLRLDSRR